MSGSKAHEWQTSSRFRLPSLNDSRRMRRSLKVIEDEFSDCFPCTYCGDRCLPDVVWCRFVRRWSVLLAGKVNRDELLRRGIRD